MAPPLAAGRAQGRNPRISAVKIESTKTKLDAVMSGDLESVRQLGSPLEITGAIARAAICAPPGHRLLIGDFSGIESRVLAWIADEPMKLAQWTKFDQTGAPEDDPYEIIGRSLGHPEAEARKFGKIADLAFGFQGGVGAYRNFAPEDDPASEEQIESFKLAWRAKHPHVEQFWWGINRAAVTAVERAGDPIDCGRLRWQCKSRNGAKFLLITLPSGRRLSYPFPKIISNRFHRPSVEFMDNSLINGTWTPCNHGAGAYGGLWTENIVSGIARDLLAAAMQRLETAGYPVVLHIHDEIVCELRNGEGCLEEFKQLLESVPEWAQGLPVAAKTRNGPRFAEVDAPVEHIASSLEPPPPKPRIKRAAKGKACTPSTEPLSGETEGPGAAPSGTAQQEDVEPSPAIATADSASIPTDVPQPKRADPPPANPPPLPPPPPLPSGGSQTADNPDPSTDSQDGLPFDDRDLVRRGYRFTRGFDYTLPDGTLSYELRRYDLRDGIRESKARPRKQFRPRRLANGAWITGAGPRHILYNWKAILRAGPGAIVLLPEGEGKVDALMAAGLLATTVLSHQWSAECVAALTGYHLIILADTTRRAHNTPKTHAPSSSRWRRVFVSCPMSICGGTCRQ
jgi:hypothetical protein